MTPTMIMFAIRAALKIGAAAQEAYITATRQRELILPLAIRFEGLDTDGAYSYFLETEIRERFLEGKTGSPHPKAEQISELLDMYAASTGFGATPQAKELVAYCRECQQILALESGTEWEKGQVVSNLDEKEALGLITLSTWTRDGEAQPQWWKDFGETLFDIGLEYAMSNPTICNPSTSTGRAFQTFLGSLEKIELTGLKAKDVPGTLLVVTLDAVAANPDLLSGGQRGQKLIGETVKALSLNIDEKLSRCEPADRDSVREWGALVFKSILTSAGRMAVENPGEYLGIQGDKSEEIASAVGGALLDIVVPTQSGAMNLSAAFSTQALEAISKAALTVVAKYPALAVKSKNKGVQGLIQAMANDLASLDNIYGKESLPDMLRLLLENTGENLELIWPNTNAPKSHLFITAASTTLKALAHKSPNDTWKLDFSHSDAVEVTQAVFSELQANPAWLVGKSTKVQELLGTVLDQTLLIVRAKGGKEVTRNAAKMIISTSLHTALSRLEFTEKYPAADSTQPFIGACLDVILAAAFEDPDIKVKCRLTRDAGLDVLLEASFAAIGSATLNTPDDKQKALGALERVLTQLVGEIKQGKGMSLQGIHTRFESELNKV